MGFLLNMRLRRAVKRGDAPAVTSLLRRGADVETKDREEFTCLMAACADSEGSVGPVLRLLQAGADPEAVDGIGRNALDYALISGYREIAEHLRARGVEPNLDHP